jgi:hypothetical protein
MKKLLALLIILITCLTACDSFVDVDTPNSQLTGDNVFKDVTTANAAMADVYAKLRDGGALTGTMLGTSYTLGLYSDELTYYSLSQSGEFTNSLIGSSGSPAAIWTDSYRQIYGANAVIEGVAHAVALPEADRARLRGEALFARALSHFNLVNIFGDVPYVTSTDYEVNRQVSRMPVEEVYQHLIDDLNEALTLIPEDYPTDGRVRPNKATAHALLARVYLYNGDWAEAANEASAVINNPLYALEENLDNVFLKESTETIWQFMPKLEGDNTNEASVFVFLTGPPPVVALSDWLATSFEAGDQRREHWVAEVTDMTDSWYHATKYKQNTNTGSSVEYSVVFRLAEMYLIRSEARARQGEVSSAAEDLNTIRNRAGLPDSPAVASADIIEAVLEERRHELFTEHGHRFFDLKRFDLLDEVLSPVKPGWDHTDMHWPIPNSDLLSNPNLNQNPGY